MIGIRVPVQKAQQVKKKLIKNDLSIRGYKPIREKDHIIFPVHQALKGFLTVEREFAPIVKQPDYKDLLTSLPFQHMLPSSYDMVGDIIVIDIKPELVPYKEKIGQALLHTHASIKTVLMKSDIHQGEFRTQPMEVIAGEHRKETMYIEHGTRLVFDVENVYFSSRLSTERKRIFSQIQPGEKILVMFSGCGVYPLVIAKNTQAKKIIGIEKNPVGHNYAVMNKELNKVKNVEFLVGDVRDRVPELIGKFDRIIMPLPKQAHTFLDVAFQAAKKGTIIHLYDFEHESEFSKAHEKIDFACKKAKITYEIVDTISCGQYAPGKYRLCIDFVIK